MGNNKIYVGVIGGVKYGSGLGMSKIKRSKKEKIFLILVSCVILCVAAGMITTLLWGYPVRYRNAESIFEELSEKGYMENEVLLIGSSFMEYWSTSAEDLSPLTTYNMGVASTVVSDWSKWIDKFILPFKPRAIVVYVGSNDMSGGVGSKSGEAVAQELKEFFSDIREKLQNTEIYYVSVAPTPAREKTWEQAQKCNGLIKEYCDAESYLHFIDCTDALLNGDKSLKREIYKGDNLHFNEKGYEIWKSVIAPILTSEL